MPRPRAFIVEALRRQDQYEDLKQISDRLGFEVVFLFDHNDRRPSIFDYSDFLKAIRDKLTERNFNIETDAFVTTGRGIPLVMTALAIGSDFDQWPQLIVFDATARKGVEYTLLDMGAVNADGA